MEYIIENVTSEEQQLLEDNCVDYYYDGPDSTDIVFDDDREYYNAVNILGRY